MKTTRTMRWAASAVAGAALFITPVALAGSASAATTATNPQICVQRGPSGTLTSKGNFMLWNWDRQPCQNGTYGVMIATGTGAQGPTGPKGDTGPAGPKGDTGAQGPTGVVSTGTHDLTTAVGAVPTGGSFVANSTDAGTVALGAGTYLISLNAKAAPTAATGAVQIFPQFFIYNQARNSGFTGDLLNVGSGALESGTNFNIDSYYSGSGEITLSAPTTLHFYAFGYDSDRGASSYNLESLSFTATQVTPAS